MNRFILKFYIVFITIISLMFFSLVFFQKNAMEKEHETMMFFEEQMNMMDEFAFHRLPPPKEKPKESPLAIPIILIFAISSVFVCIVLSHINKHYIKPLSTIQGNVRKIKDGSLDIDFETNSKDKNMVDTFDTMNDMVQGLKQREKLQNNYIRNLVHDLRVPVIAQEKAWKFCLTK